MTPFVCLFLFLAMTGHSSATYCVCKDGVGEQALQGALDYACGHGADCSAIQPNGACYNPNTVKDHCTYAVNSYFQNSRQVAESCVFSGAATVSATPPTNIASTCRYPSSTGNGTIPTTGTPGTATTFPPRGSSSNVPNHAVALFRSVNTIFFTIFITLWIIA
ncbi:hypothetical protein HRI_002012800 [Hibiscus trionum]|uniref:X8 domain-containing protein n=1 Tax=Hibiscus trionum TaxID=183268 RepID=A0A9W7M2C8_HIBTR|nr:hypothetical protein HRI_002012800 [Hibiscus trionum]